MIPDLACARRACAEGLNTIMMCQQNAPTTTTNPQVLIEKHLGLAYAYAARFRGRGVPTEDLRQVAAEALVKAARRYDPGRDTSFASYAVPTILGMLKRYFRDATWNVHVPRSLQERALNIGHARENLTQQLGRSPTPTEIAAELRVPADQVLAAIEAAAGYYGAPLEFSDETEPATGAGEDPGIEMTENLRALAPMIAALSERDRRMLSLRFGAELTQNQIAAEIGISQMQVSRMLTRCLSHLRRQLLDAG